MSNNAKWGTPLPLLLAGHKGRLNQFRGTLLLEPCRSGQPQIVELTYNMPEAVPEHVRAWMTKDRLPAIDENSLFLRSPSNSESHVFLCLREKYRKYLYPICINHKNHTWYLTAQAIYLSLEQNIRFEQRDGRLYLVISYEQWNPEITAMDNSNTENGGKKSGTGTLPTTKGEKYRPPGLARELARRGQRSIDLQRLFQVG